MGMDRFLTYMTPNPAFESGRADKQRALVTVCSGAPAQRER